MPERIQLRRTKGWRKPEGAVVVARPTRWGNPYSVRPCIDGSGWAVAGRGYVHTSAGEPWTKAEATEVAVRLHREVFRPGSTLSREAVIQLAGKDLACWCPLEDAQGNRVPCHADVLLEIANGDQP